VFVGALRCPRCTFTLAPHKHAGVEIDVCPRCHGSFLDAGDAHSSLGPGAEVAAWERTGVATRGRRGSLACPKGHGLLTPYRFAEPPLEIDVCATCSGMWLDAREAIALQNATRGARPMGSIAHAGGPTEADRNSGVGWYLFGLFTALPVEEFNYRRRFPWVVVALIVACVAVFVVEINWGIHGQLEKFVRNYAVVPRTLVMGYAPHSVITHMFLHGGFAHLLGNMYFLYTFGDNVEDRLGKVRFLVVYFATGLCAMAAQLVPMIGSDVPLLGASGAISGLMGVYMALFPKARMYQVLFFIRLRIPVWVYLGVWIGLQSLSGFRSIVAHQSGGVAWFAHIGGFVAGLLWGIFNRARFADGAEARRSA
jgi:membrane associated rhomboid family serine protease